MVTAASAPVGAPPRPMRAGGLLRGDPERLPDRMAALTASRADAVVPMRAGRLGVYLVGEPGLARELLTRPSGVGKGRGIDALKFLLGDGLLTSSGELHRRQRRLLNPLFTPEKIAGYGHIAISAAQARLATWRDGGRVDLAAEMNAVALDVVGRALFGANLSDDGPKISAALDQMLPVFPRLIRPWGFALLRFPNPIRSTLRRSAASLDAIVAGLVANRTAALAGGATPSGDLLDALVLARDEDTGEPMPTQQVRDEALTLLLAGHETTAVALAWTWFELSRNPLARAWLVEELDSVEGRAALERADWAALHRTRACVAEAMRLHPPAHTIGRRILEPTSLGGHDLAARSLCLIPIYAIHRDARWWSAPTSYQPQRWITPEQRFDERAPGQPRGAYLPFGAGARICIGATMAWMESVLVLATLAREVEADVPEGFDPGHQPAVTLRPRRGVPAVLRRRVVP
jgi:cytochrome P450